MEQIPEKTPARLRAEALVDSGRMLANMARYREALEMMERAAEADPSYDRPRLAKAFVLSKLGRTADALDIVDAYIRDHPGNAYAHTTRGTCLMMAGRRDEAEGAYREGVRLGGEEYLHAYNYACFLALEGREEETRETLGRALALAPNINTRAATDPDLEPYREREWFQELVAFKRRDAA
jgi:tetratricopeptide (TPR) repeat protein